MMASTETRRTYDVADTANDTVNVDTLKQEMIDAGLPCTGVEHVGTSIVCTFNDNLEDTEVTTADSTVAAHEGDTFGSIDDEVVMAGPGDHDVNDWQDIGSALDVGPLPAGKYQLAATCEIALLDTATGVGVQARLLVNDAEVAIDSWDLLQWHRANLSLTATVEAGYTATIKLQYQRIGTAGTGVQFQRARLSVSPA